MMSTNLHLVDNEGLPLASHIVEAVERAEPGINGRFSRVCDPAALSSSIEEGARRIAEHEREYGPLENTSAFTWKTLMNAALSLVRGTSRENTLPPKALNSLAGISRIGSPEAIWAGIEAAEALASLSERDREICHLESQGFQAAEIAAFLEISTAVVWKAKSRRLAKLAASSSTK